MAMMVLKFVDSIVATPATLFNLNNGVDADIDMDQDFNLDPAPVRRITAPNNLGDGALITSDSYDNRSINFTVGLHAPTKALKMAQMDALIDELSKPTNLIMYQLDSNQPPSFFQTYRADDYNLDDGGNGKAEVWYVTCAIPAKPFALGLRRDLSSVLVSNDPSAASGNKTIMDITGIVGDAPTEAFVKIDSIGPQGKVWIGTRSFNNPTSITPFYQAEAGTLGTDTTLRADAAASSTTVGTGNSTTQTTFVNNNMVTRLTFTAPNGSDPVALRGRYRVIVRAAVSLASNIQIRWVQTETGDFVPGPSSGWDLTGNWSLIDLGMIESPSPQMTPATLGYSGLSLAQTATALGIQAKRNSGSGTLFLDYMYLLPADERLCCVYQFADVTGGSIILDGPQDATYGLASGSTPFGATRVNSNNNGIITRQGGLPMLVPGVTNRWNTLFSDSANGTTKNFQVSYWPKWRKVASV